MDHDQSPDHSPPDHERRARDEMATMVASSAVPNMPGPMPLPSDTGPRQRRRSSVADTASVAWFFRAASTSPATFGESDLLFNAHILTVRSKHTGERPFSCHCGKQFSRLDNLRQHAQTVHADKHDQNERMMRDLTSLHATMAAANKGNGSARAPRRGPAPPNVHTDPVQSEPSTQRHAQSDQAGRGHPWVRAGYLRTLAGLGKRDGHATSTTRRPATVRATFVSG